MRIFAFLYIALIVFSCSTPNENGKLKIVCTTGIVGDAVRNAVNADCDVFIMMGPGTDPHLYKPSAGDLAKLGEADIIIANGLRLEGKMEEVLVKLSQTKKIIFAAEGFTESNLLAFEGHPDSFDPHIWFDVELWKQACGNIYGQLKDLECYDQEKAEAYLNDLGKLDYMVKNKIAEIPAEQRVLITAHDAFSYFGEAYNIKVKGLQGISTVAEYGLRDVTNLVDYIVNNNIKAIFTETSISDRSIQAVLDGCKERGHEVKLGGELYSDALGPVNSAAGDYQGMVKTNVNIIVNALK